MKKSVQLNTHISGKFNQELENLTNSVLSMGGEVEQQFFDAIASIKSNNAKLAEAIILNKARINSMEMQIDDECMRVIAKRNPTASDLRLIMTVSKSAADIDCVGGEIQKLVRLVTKDKLPGSRLIRSGIIALAEQLSLQMRGAFDAYARQDERAAIAAYEQGSLIGKRYKELIKQTAREMQRDSDNMLDWFEVLWAIRALERIGDSCENICEYVLYLNYGMEVRHTSMKKTIKKLSK